MLWLLNSTAITWDRWLLRLAVGNNSMSVLEVKERVSHSLGVAVPR
jgi:hypothetical protein